MRLLLGMCVSFPFLKSYCKGKLHKYVSLSVNKLKKVEFYSTLDCFPCIVEGDVKNIPQRKLLGHELSASF